MNSYPVPQPLQAAMISQFNFERYSADVYYALSTALDTINLEGFAAYLRKRAAEERDHAGKFDKYLADRGVRPVVEGLPAPEVPLFSSVMDAGESCFRAALAHEIDVTDRLNVLHALADEVEDPQTCIFLQWFLLEQVEEMQTLESWITKFELGRGNGAAIILLDHEAGG